MVKRARVVCVLLSVVVLSGQDFVLGQSAILQDSKAAISVQIGHSDRISAIAFSAEGSWLATGGNDGTLKLWDVASGRLLRTLSEYSKPVLQVAFSPVEKIIAAYYNGIGIQIWSVADGHLLRTIEQGGDLAGFPSFLAYSPDGLTLAAARRDGAISLWNVPGGKALHVLNQSSPRVKSIAFSRDGRFLYSALGDGTINIWDVESGRKLRALKVRSTIASATCARTKSSVEIGKMPSWEGECDAYVSAAFSPDRKTVAFGGESGVELLATDSGKPLRIIAKSSGWLSAATFSPDGTILAVVRHDQATDRINRELWDVRNGRMVLSIQMHEQEFENIAFSPDGKMMAVGASGNFSIFGDGESVALFDIASRHEVQTLTERAAPVGCTAFSGDGKLLASCAAGGVAVWDMSSGKRKSVLRGAVASAALSPDGKMLAAFQSPGVVGVWDVDTEKILRTLNVVGLFTFLPDGTLATASWSTFVGHSDPAGGKVLADFVGLWGTPVAVSPNGKLLSLTNSGDKSGAVELWDIASGKLLLTLDGVSSDVAFSRDDKFLASNVGNGTIEIWNLGTGKKSARVVGAGWRPTFAFSPDDKILVSGSTDWTVKLWNAQDGRLLNTLRGHSGNVNSIAFSANENLLASGSADGTTRIWDVASGKERASFIGFNDGSSIAVTPEGFFASSSPSAEDNLNVRIGNRVFGISSFRENFYRPDLVRKALAGEDISKYGSIDRVKLSPEVEFASNTPSTTKDANFRFSLNLTNGGGGFGPVRVFWNGTVITQDNDLPLGGETLSRSYTVPLLGGDNALRATAFNADGDMWSETQQTVTAELPAPARTSGAHGTLYAVVVGIKDFPKAPKDLQLIYPKDDAALIADTLQKKAAPLFDRVEVHLLNDAGNTDRAHIEEALKAVQAKAGADDEFVFYVASHGYVTGKRYYLITSNVGPSDPASLEASAISAQDLSALIANIHAPKKLVILDTCDAGNAGEVLKQNGGLTAKDAATILGRDYGFTVLAATGSDQEAQGGYKNHGVFTYVVANGLAGQAADPTNGIVTSLLLAKHVNDNVPLLAQTVFGNPQIPVAEPQGKEFAITKVR
jgi:WD40 repeat protein